MNTIDTAINTEKEKTRKKLKRSRGLSIIKNNMELFLLTLPALLCFLIFNYLPMFGVIIAFKSYNYNKGILGSKWIGFKNFEFFFTSQDAIRITRNTVCYSSIFIITGIIGAVIIALFLYEVSNKLSIKIYQTCMILPRFLSWVIVGYITYTLFNPVLGILNQIMKYTGHDPVQWFTEPKYWPGILIITNLWKHIGMDCIIYYAALLGIDQELYEAAKIDGASRWQQTIKISIPSILPIISILSILALGSIFRGDFGLFYQIPRDVGVLYPVTDIVDTYVFRGLRQGDVGITAAIGLFQSVVGLIFIVGTNLIVKKINPENSLF